MAANDPAYQYTKIGADAERAAKKAAEDNLPVDMMNDRRMQSYAGLWAIIGAKAAATVVLAEAREQFEQDIVEAEKRGAVRILRHVADRTERQLARGVPVAKTVDEAMTQAIDGLRSIADRTERDGMSGEVTP